MNRKPPFCHPDTRSTGTDVAYRVAAGSFVSAKAQSEALDRFLKTNIKVLMLDVKIAARGL